MGIFSFIKNAGAKIFGSKRREEEAKAAELKKEELEAQKARELENLVRGLGLQISNLRVEVNEGTATVYGTTDCVEEQEKAVLAIGNVEGIETVDERIDVIAPAPEVATRTISVAQNQSSQFYTVKKGDTLWSIASAVYGDGTKHKLIFEANRPMLKTSDAIYPDQVLRIPPMA